MFDTNVGPDASPGGTSSALGAAPAEDAAAAASPSVAAILVDQFTYSVSDGSATMKVKYIHLDTWDPGGTQDSFSQNFNFGDGEIVGTIVLWGYIGIYISIYI